MHVTSKEVDDKGVHILTSNLDADGPNALCSADAKLTASVISVQRTESGGVKVQVALTITEPAQTPAVVVTPKDMAVSYFIDKGLSPDAALNQVNRFGVERVLAAREKEREDQSKALDKELDALLASPPAEQPKPPTPTTPAVN